MKPTPPTPLPLPLLSGVDWTALAWAAGWALVFSLTLLPSRRRWEVKQGQTPTPWWVVILETMLGGLVGGMIFAVALPEQWPSLRGPGKQALLSVAGASVGPLLGKWIPTALAGLIAYFSEKKFGVRIEVEPRTPRPPGGGDDETA